VLEVMRVDRSERPPLETELLKWSDGEIEAEGFLEMTA